MNLKEAIEYTRKNFPDLKWVCQDSNGDMWAVSEKPTIDEETDEWDILVSVEKLQSEYLGKCIATDWRNSLTEIATVKEQPTYPQYVKFRHSTLELDQLQSMAKRILSGYGIAYESISVGELNDIVARLQAAGF